MKGKFVLLLTLALLFLLCSPAQAAEGEGQYAVCDVSVSPGYTLTPLDGAGAPLSPRGTPPVYSGVEGFSLAFPGDPAEEYTVFLLYGADGTPTGENLRYIGQQRGSGTGFLIQPESLREVGAYSVYLSGTGTVYTKVAGFQVMAADRSAITLEGSGTQLPVPPAFSSTKTGEVSSAFTAQVLGADGTPVTSPVFHWALTPKDGAAMTGISLHEGVVTVTSAASGGTYTLTVSAAKEENPALGKELSASADIVVYREAPKPTFLMVQGDGTLAVPPVTDGGTAAENRTAPFSAQVYDQYGGVMTGQIVTWRVQGGDDSVTMDPAGIVTITSQTPAGEVTVTAACGGLSASAGLTITREPSRGTSMAVFWEGNRLSDKDTLGIPDSKTYTVTVWDQFGEVMAGAPVLLSLENPAQGFGLSGNTVTVDKGTKDGGRASLNLTCGDLSQTIVLNARGVTVNWGSITLKNAAITYGERVKEAFSSLPAGGTASDHQGKALTGTFTLKENCRPSAGSHTAVVVFTVTTPGTHCGVQFEKTYSITVSPKALTRSMVTVEGEFTYTGQPIRPVPRVEDPAGTLAKGDYTVTYGENIEAGTGTVTVTGKRNYTGSVTVEFPIAEAQVEEVIPGAILVEGPQGQTVTVVLPAAVLTPGTVAVILHADGREEVVPNSVPTALGLKASLPGGSTVLLLDRAQTFADVPTGEWYEDAVDFNSARGMMQGTAREVFSPQGLANRAMMMTMVARMAGCDTQGGATWYEKGVSWAVERGISDGENPFQNVTREQLIVMLWRYAGEPLSGQSLDHFGDASQVSPWAQEGVRWAVEQGILQGKGSGILDPGGYATRAEVAQLFMNFMVKTA